MTWQVKTVVLLLLAMLALGVSFSPTHALETITIGGVTGADPEHPVESYPILLALSGGGTRGLASVGVIKALEEKGIRVAAVTGTSVGGIIGGLYACGYSPDELQDIAGSIDLPALLTNEPARKTMFLSQRQERDRHLLSVRFDGFKPVIPKALTAGQRLTSFLTRLTAMAGYHSGGDFTRLPIPFKTISTDIVTGNEIVLDSGSLSEAMRATMGFPLAFTPLARGDQLLMDGGMVTPIPVDLVRSMCDTVDFVVAVNTTAPLNAKDDISTPVDIANQVTTIMVADKLAAQLARADISITPPIPPLELLDIKYRDRLVQIGYESGLAAADSIIGLIASRRSSRILSIVEVVMDSCVPTRAAGIGDGLRGRSMSRQELVGQLRKLTAEMGLFSLKATLNTVCSTSAEDHDISLYIEAHDILPINQLQINISGNRVFSDSNLVKFFLGNDSLLTPEALQNGLDRILHRYRSAGYDLADIETVEVDPCNGSLKLTIDEAVVERIDVEGNRHTRDWYIRTNFPLKVGQPYSTRRADEGLRNIYGTDLFSRVTVDLKKVRGGAVVKIRVEEKENLQLRLGWHWDDEFQSEEFAEFVNDNVMGIGLQYLLHARYALDRQTYFAEFKAYRIFSTMLTARLKVNHSRLDRNLFDTVGNVVDMRKENRTGFAAHFGQQISRLGAVSAGISIEELEYEQGPDLPDERFGLRIFRIESLVETFNRIPFPESGKKHLFELQFAGKTMGGDIEYTRFYSSLEAYWGIGKHLNYHPRLAVGISRTGLPPSEKFFLGGIHSFAGYRTYELTGDKVMVFSNELRVKLPLRLYLSSRFDIGEVYTSADDMKLSNLRHGLGLILALDTPVGPVELAYGLTENNQDRFYFNAGLQF